MQYNQPFDQPLVPNAPYVDGNATTGQPGSIPRGAAIEYPQREVINAAAAAGLVPNNGDLTQLAQAMSIGLYLGALGGSANALTGALPTLPTQPGSTSSYAIPALVPGMTFHGIVPAANTGPATLALGGFGTAPGAKPIVRKDGSALSAGDLPAGAVVSWRWDGTSFRVVGMVASDVIALILANAPQILTTGPVIYVRSDGNDNNLGTGNTPAAAVQTLAGAFKIASRLIVVGAPITVQFGIPGTYAAAVPPTGLASPIVVYGDPNNQDSYIVTGVGTTTAVFAHLFGNVTYQGVKLSNNGNITNLLAAAYGGVVALNYVTLAAAGGNTQAAILALQGGSINLGPGIKVVSNFGSLISAVNNGVVAAPNGSTITASGGPAFSNATVVANNGGRVGLGGSVWSGAAAGPRYSATNGGGIDTAGGGTSFIFGSTAGASPTGYYT